MRCTEFTREQRKQYDEVYGKKLDEQFKKSPNPDADSKKRERTTSWDRGTKPKTTLNSKPPMKSPAYTFKDEAGRTLLTNGRRVSFFVGSRPARAFGGERDINTPLS